MLSVQKKNFFDRLQGTNHQGGVRHRRATLVHLFYIIMYNSRDVIQRLCPSELPLLLTQICVPGKTGHDGKKEIIFKQEPHLIFNLRKTWNANYLCKPTTSAPMYVSRILLAATLIPTIGFRTPFLMQGTEVFRIKHTSKESV